MQRVHSMTALLTVASIYFTAEWFVRRERSLVAKLIASLGY